MKKSVLAIGMLMGLLSAPAFSQTWRGLTVAPGSRCSPYNPDHYDYPQSIEFEIPAAIGVPWSPYTGETFYILRETDIEHIVARSEAHDSGLCSQSREKRREFARDLMNLTLAAPVLNRNVKIEKDAADWLPDQNRCWFVETVFRVKRKYLLSVDEREREALEAVMTQECGREEAEVVGRPRQVSEPRPRQASREERARRAVLLTEIKDHVVEPCLQAVSQEGGLDNRQMEALRMLTAGPIQNITDTTLDAVSELRSRSARMAVYEFSLRNCLEGAGL